MVGKVDPGEDLPGEKNGKRKKQGGKKRKEVVIGIVMEAIL